MIDNELIDEYINRFNMRFSFPAKGYTVSKHFNEITALALEQSEQEIANMLISYVKEKDQENSKQHFGVYSSYGIGLAAAELKGKGECITHQEGFKEESVIKKNLDELLNLKTELENDEASISNIIEWCIDPESNLEISDDIWKCLIFQPLKTIYRTILPEKNVEIVVMLPPVSKDIDFPDWTILFSQLKMKNVDLRISDYSHLYKTGEQERTYIISYQTDGIREYVIISAYELIRGRSCCIGSLAFDVWDNDREYELQNIIETNVTLSWNSEKFKKNEINEIFSDCHLIKSKYQAGSGFISFLGSHAISFMQETYKATGNVSLDMKDIVELFYGNEALQAIEICSKLLGKTNCYDIALEDIVAVANRLEQSKEIKKTEMMTIRRSRLGTYKALGSNLDLRRLKNIPANYATITWKLRDRNMKIPPYETLKVEKYSERQLIESIVKYYEPATTENIAEELLFLVNKNVNIDPSALFAAKLFLVLMTMNSLKIDSRNEEIKNISNVDI